MSCVYFLPQIESLVLSLVVDAEEVDRKSLGEGRPKGNCLEATVSGSAI
jgi:hypothetical protein